MLKLAVPDMVSPSYFVLLAAADLGFFKAEGLDVEIQLLFPIDAAFRGLRDGTVDLVGGSAHAALSTFRDWEGVKLLCAQAQGMYWFLVMHADLGARHGDVSVVRGRQIGASPWVDMGLRALLDDSGIDIAADQVGIAPVPRLAGQTVNFGVTASKRLQERAIDGFWANGMGAELAVRGGYGTVVIDARRGDGPPGAFDYTFAAVAASDRLVTGSPGTAAAVVRAVVATQCALTADPSRAVEVGRSRFPPDEAALIAELVRRDAPYYSAVITPQSVAALNRFARRMGILQGDVPYEAVVAAELAPIWT